MIELYSSRTKKNKNPEIYNYKIISRKLKIQIRYIITDCIGEGQSKEYIRKNPTKVSVGSKIYRLILNTLYREYGVFNLIKDADSYRQEIINYFLRLDTESEYNDYKDEDENEEIPDYLKALDIIELTFSIINTKFRDMGESQSKKADIAISELNQRLKQSSVGYQFIGNQIVKADSEFIHSEVTTPVLSMLFLSDYYNGSADEFLCAHKHYRNNEYKECLNYCLKSFESLLKAIHVKHNWNFNQNDTVSTLITSCTNNKLIPSYLNYQIKNIEKILSSGVPTIRNNQSGHGQGVDVITVPEHLASYMLHLTATNLLFLIQCEKILNDEI